MTDDGDVRIQNNSRATELERADAQYLQTRAELPGKPRVQDELISKPNPSTKKWTVGRSGTEIAEQLS